jgi:hypothetical protein
MWGCLRESVDIIGNDTNCRKTNDQVARFAIEGFIEHDNFINAASAVSSAQLSAANAASSVQPAANAASSDRVEIEKARQQTNNVPRQTETTFKG